MNQETVSQMSTGDMEKTIFQILTDNSMSEKDANDTVNGMSFTIWSDTSWNSTKI